MLSTTEKLRKVFRLVMAEFVSAARKHKPYNSAHEGFAVIYEEFDELKAEVWKRERDSAAMLCEAVQLASTVVRFVVDVCLKGD